uniref:Uncharacterized protein n=1 Tax=Anopheles quadriannulatus TaxID=34691 RepID=A0A182XR42_ANOQN
MVHQWTNSIAASKGKILHIPSGVTQARCRPRLNIIRTLAQNNTPRPALLAVLKGWFLPRLLYGAEISSLGSTDLIQQFAPLYHRAVKYISGCFRTSPTDAALVECGVLPLKYLIMQKISNMAGRIIEARITIGLDINKNKQKTVVQSHHQDRPVDPAHQQA